MEFYYFFRDFISAKAANLADVVRDFTENYVPIYDTECDETADLRCLDAYKKAVAAVDEWMKLLVKIVAVEYGEDVPFATLIFPDGVHKYASETLISGGDLHTRGKSLPMLHTPIGDMNYSVYRSIVDVPNNPVMIFYKALQEQIHRTHILVSLDPDNIPDDLLNPALLETCGINDPLNICSLDSSLAHIDDFFDGYGMHENCYGVLQEVLPWHS